MATNVQEPSTKRQTSSSRVALIAFSSLAVAALTTYSYFQWSSRSQKRTATVWQETEHSPECIQDDDQSDSESAEIDSTPPSSPCPQNEKSMFDTYQEDVVELDFHTKRTERDVPTQNMVPLIGRNHHIGVVEPESVIPTPRDVEEEKPELYREDAIRMFKGFAKNQRSKKGISLKSACLVYKEAWTINKNPRDMVLPGRVISHFKHTLPSKFD